MALRTMSLAAAAVLAVVFAAPTFASTSRHPHLTIVSGSTMHVRGTGFHRHERVRLAMRSGLRDPVVRHVTASQSGTFSATVPDTSSGPCGRVTITATGALGSRATLSGVMRPNCIAY